jgi:hypothetical protein
MTSETFDNVLESLMTNQPFRLFTIELMSGKRMEVDHSRSLIFKNGSAVFWAPGGTFVWFDHDSVQRIIGAEATVEA